MKSYSLKNLNLKRPTKPSKRKAEEEKSSSVKFYLDVERLTYLENISKKVLTKKKFYVIL